VSIDLYEYTPQLLGEVSQLHLRKNKKKRYLYPARGDKSSRASSRLTNLRTPSIANKLRLPSSTGGYAHTTCPDNPRSRYRQSSAADRGRTQSARRRSITNHPACRIGRATSWANAPWCGDSFGRYGGLRSVFFGRNIYPRLPIDRLLRPTFPPILGHSLRNWSFLVTSGRFAITQQLHGAMISVTHQSLHSLELILTFIANETGAAFVSLLGYALALLPNGHSY
jgi:hypothetical protein